MVRRHFASKELTIASIAAVVAHLGMLFAALA
jgi:hypothetical protein